MTVKFLLKKDQLFSHMMLHRIAINGKRQLIQLNTPESVLSFPAPNMTLQNNMNINASSEEVSDFLKNKIGTT